ncbi:MAG TPA: hypothetical protein VD971_05895 [Phycisphaerales bacterium]|nr:hypothetical protein [Phycisphaerales bacterium]
MSGSAPRFPVDALAEQRRKTRLTTAGAVTIISLAAVWALWPTPSRQVPALSLDPGEAPHRAPTTVVRDAELALGAAAALWHAPPKPPRTPVTAAPPPPPPLRVQLIGIATAGDGSSSFVAVFYDPDADKVVRVHRGDRVGDRLLTVVEAHAVTLALGADRQRITLDPPTKEAP